MPDPWDNIEPQWWPIENIQISLHNIDPDSIGKRNDRAGDPVDLILDKDRYLVRDGRHRILAALLEGDRKTVWGRLLT
jgi:hypothetical protein